MKFKVLQTIRDRDTGEIFQPGSIWDDRDQRTPYERDLLIAMGAVAPLPPPVEQRIESSSAPVQTGKEKTK